MLFSLLRWRRAIDAECGCQAELLKYSRKIIGFDDYRGGHHFLWLQHFLDALDDLGLG